MIKVLEMYKIMQPVHKRVMQLASRRAAFESFHTSSFRVEVTRYGLSISNHASALKLFECTIITSMVGIASGRNLQSIQEGNCRIPFDYYGKIMEGKYKSSVGPNAGAAGMINFPPTEEEYFQASILQDIMSYDDMMGLYNLVSDITTDAAVQTVMAESRNKVRHAVIFPRLILQNNTVKYIDERAEQFLHELRCEVVPYVELLLNKIEDESK